MKKNQSFLSFIEKHEGLLITILLVITGMLVKMAAKVLVTGAMELGDGELSIWVLAACSVFWMAPIAACKPNMSWAEKLLFFLLMVIAVQGGAILNYSYILPIAWFWVVYIGVKAFSLFGIYFFIWKKNKENIIKWFIVITVITIMNIKILLKW